MAKKKYWTASYEIRFTTHNHLSKGNLNIYPHYELNNGKKIRSVADANTYLKQYYECNNEEDLVRVPDWIYKSDKHIGDTELHVTEIKELVEDC